MYLCGRKSFAPHGVGGSWIGPAFAEKAMAGERMLFTPHSVGCGGIGECDLVDAELEFVDELYALHEGVVLVGDFVLPATEAATGVDALLIERGNHFGEGFVAVYRWGRVAVFQRFVPGGDDVFAALDEVGIEHALYGFLNDGSRINVLMLRLADLGHERPLGVDVGHVVRAVVGEHSDAVEGAVVFGEVHPALGGEAFFGFAFEAYANDMCSGVFQVSG